MSVVTARQCWSTGRTKSYGTCPPCGGKGVSSRFWCKRCGGEGRAVTLRHVRVKIPAGTALLQDVPPSYVTSLAIWQCTQAAYAAVFPMHCLIHLCILFAGVDHGSVLRLNGQGDVGTFGGKRGDILLRFLVSLDVCCSCAAALQL